jgi:hypothetical protein
MMEILFKNKKSSADCRKREDELATAMREIHVFRFPHGGVFFTLPVC